MNDCLHVLHKVNGFVLAITCTLFFQSSLFAQEKATVKGQIKTELNLPIRGVSVIANNTKTNFSVGTQTDSLGVFSLTNVPAGGPYTFQVSAVGYQSQTLTGYSLNANNVTTIVVKLQNTSQELTDVVVVGYGTVKKKDLTGSISSIGQKDLNQGPVMNPLQQIAGKAAGVSIIQVGSEPGKAPTVRIRGVTSLEGGSDPLVVIDGMQGDLTLYQQLAPGDIETIDILKDASATAIYGARGAAGVMIVTTKKARTGQSQIDINSSASIDVIRKKLEMMDAKEWWETAIKYDLPGDVNYGSNTDWFALMTQTGLTQNHTLALSGGTNQFNYRASVTAQLQKGIVIKSDFKSYIANFQANQKVFNDRLHITFQANNNVQERTSSPNNVGRAAYISNLITNAYLTRPTDPVYFPDGRYFNDPLLFAYFNPYAIAVESISEDESNKFFTSLNLNLKIIKGLEARWFGVWRKSDDLGGSYVSPKTTIPEAVSDSGQAYIRNSIYQERLTNFGLNYKKAIKNHSFELLALYEYQTSIWRGNWIEARGFQSDFTTWHSIQTGSIAEGKVRSSDRRSGKNVRELSSYLARANYSFKDRYLLTASLRRDGSSVFGKNYPWAYFPSASFAWRLDEEPFLSNIDIISSLKFRAGYGETGNQALGPYQTKQLVSDQGVAYFGGSVIKDFAIFQNSNPNLRWETKKQTNIGLDFGLHKNKITGTIDLFRAITSNLLYRYNVPVPPFPLGEIVANVGSLKNEGVELTLSYQLIKKKDMSLTLGGNVSYLQNKVLNLSGTIPVPGSKGLTIPITTASKFVDWGLNSYLSVGHPIGVFSIYQHDGIDEDGQEKVVDRNKDGKISGEQDAGDRYFAGSVLPKYFFGFYPSFTWKNLSVSMLFRGQTGNYIYNNLKLFLSQTTNVGKSNLLKSAASLGLRNAVWDSDFWLEKGDFVRFENLTIGYNFNISKLKNIEALKLSFTAMNLAVFTKYTGIDPELNSAGGRNGSKYDAENRNNGADYGTYPRTTNLALGLNVIFK